MNGGELVNVVENIDHPLLWFVPFGGFIIISLLATVNYFLSFFPVGSGYLLMLSGSAFLCASVAGFLTELIKGRSKYVYVSMGAATIVGCIVFFAGYGFFKSNLIAGTELALVPGVNEIISNITLTILPGVFTGALIGGGIGFIPDETELTPIEPLKDEVHISPEKKFGYEKMCRRCSTPMPYDSMYCSQCGGTLKKKRTTTMKYCRYCGEKLSFLGEYCPDCGKEISLFGRPKIFIAD